MMAVEITTFVGFRCLIWLIDLPLRNFGIEQYWCVQVNNFQLRFRCITRPWMLPHVTQRVPCEEYIPETFSQIGKYISSNSGLRNADIMLTWSFSEILVHFFLFQFFSCTFLPDNLESFFNVTYDFFNITKSKLSFINLYSSLILSLLILYNSTPM